VAGTTATTLRTIPFGIRTTIVWVLAKLSGFGELIQPLTVVLAASNVLLAVVRSIFLEGQVRIYALFNIYKSIFVGPQLTVPRIKCVLDIWVRLNEFVLLSPLLVDCTTKVDTALVNMALTLKIDRAESSSSSDA
jgi:hypothetical protein